MRSEPNRLNPHQPLLNVAPLHCVPYISPTNPDDVFSSSSQKNAEAVEIFGLAMIFLPSQSTREELNDIMNATRNGVVLTGAALREIMGPRIGKVDIGEFADSYYFCVILAGVSSDESKFNLFASYEFTATYNFYNSYLVILNYFFRFKEVKIGIFKLLFCMTKLCLSFPRSLRNEKHISIRKHQTI
ncbi:hypothetical protein PTKIN_Ptkin06aG0197200 [Pterospermum kingtungense]